MFKTLLLQCFLKELVPSSDHPLVECLEPLYRIVVGVFSQILDPEFENDVSTFEETLMGAMRRHNLWMTPKVHVPSIMYQNICAVPEFLPDLPLSRRWRFSIDFFDIFYHRFKVNCRKSPFFRER